MDQFILFNRLLRRRDDFMHNIVLMQTNRLCTFEPTRDGQINTTSSTIDLHYGVVEELDRLIATLKTGEGEEVVS